MNKNKLFSVVGLIGLGLVMNACEYSDTFQGTYNGAAGTVSAYSKNTDSYCVSLAIASNGATVNSFISAQDVFDENNPIATKAFNSKGTSCDANITNYLAGTRTSHILGKKRVYQIQQVGYNVCRQVFFNEYLYQDEINFQVKNKADDAVIGTFAGTGGQQQLIDSDHPQGYGPTYFCGNQYPRPYPGPYPRPRPFAN